MSFLRQLVSLVGIFHRLPGIFVPGLMVPFVVVRCGNAVRVSGEIVKLCSALMRIVCHVLFSRPANLILTIYDRFPFETSSCNLCNLIIARFWVD
jgi:hypothetical protein